MDSQQLLRSWSFIKTFVINSSKTNTASRDASLTLVPLLHELEKLNQEDFSGDVHDKLKLLSSSLRAITTTLPILKQSVETITAAINEDPYHFLSSINTNHQNTIPMANSVSTEIGNAINVPHSIRSGGQSLVTTSKSNDNDFIPEDEQPVRIFKQFLEELGIIEYIRIRSSIIGSVNTGRTEAEDSTLNYADTKSQPLSKANESSLSTDDEQNVTDDEFFEWFDEENRSDSSNDDYDEEDIEDFEREQEELMRAVAENKEHAKNERYNELKRILPIIETFWNQFTPQLHHLQNKQQTSQLYELLNDIRENCAFLLETRPNKMTLQLSAITDIIIKTANLTKNADFNLYQYAIDISLQQLKHHIEHKNYPSAQIHIDMFKKVFDAVSTMPLTDNDQLIVDKAHHYVLKEQAHTAYNNYELIANTLNKTNEILWEYDIETLKYIYRNLPTLVKSISQIEESLLAQRTSQSNNNNAVNSLFSHELQTKYQHALISMNVLLSQMIMNDTSNDAYYMATEPKEAFIERLRDRYKAAQSAILAAEKQFLVLTRTQENSTIFQINNQVTTRYSIFTQLSRLNQRYYVTMASSSPLNSELISFIKEHLRAVSNLIDTNMIMINADSIYDKELSKQDYEVTKSEYLKIAKFLFKQMIEYTNVSLRDNKYNTAKNISKQAYDLVKDNKQEWGESFDQDLELASSLNSQAKDARDSQSLMNTTGLLNANKKRVSEEDPALTNEHINKYSKP